MAALMKVDGWPSRVEYTRLDPACRKCLKTWLISRVSGLAGFFAAVSRGKPKGVFEGVNSGSLYLLYNWDNPTTRLESNNNKGIRAAGFSPGSRVAEPGPFWASITPFRDARALISAADKKGPIPDPITCDNRLQPDFDQP